MEPILPFLVGLLPERHPQATVVLLEQREWDEQRSWPWSQDDVRDGFASHTVDAFPLNMRVAPWEVSCLFLLSESLKFMFLWHMLASWCQRKVWHCSWLSQERAYLLFQVARQPSALHHPTQMWAAPQSPIRNASKPTETCSVFPRATGTMDSVILPSSLWRFKVNLLFYWNLWCGFDDIYPFWFFS